MVSRPFWSKKLWRYLCKFLFHKKRKGIATGNFFRVHEGKKLGKDGYSTEAKKLKNAIDAQKSVHEGQKEDNKLKCSICYNDSNSTKGFKKHFIVSKVVESIKFSQTFFPLLSFHKRVLPFLPHLDLLGVGKMPTGSAFSGTKQQTSCAWMPQYEYMLKITDKYFIFSFILVVFLTKKIIERKQLYYKY